MTDSNRPEATANPTQLNLVNSNRLQALRKQSSVDESDNTQRTTSRHPAGANAQEDAESNRLRTQVNQRLAEILANLPAGKRRSLFKIRFGVDLDKLEQMPSKQAAALLKIEPNQRRKR
ncbi:hypothetical protein [Methylomonas sp. MgM2]